MSLHKKTKNTFLIVSVFLILFSAGISNGATVGDFVNFNVDQSFDTTARSQLSATLVKSTSGLYFYVEKNWWDSQYLTKKNEILTNLDNLSSEFDKPNISSALSNLDLCIALMAVTP